MADDALRIDVNGSSATCFPGSRRLRLRVASAPLGHAIEEASLSETVDGRTAVRPAAVVDEPLELRAILIPEPSREAARLEVERLRPTEAVQELVSYPRLTRWQTPEQIRRLFQLTTDVVAAVPVYRATVPWGPPFEELFASAGLEQARSGGES